jgi:uncharacterized protein
MLHISMLRPIMCRPVMYHMTRLLCVLVMLCGAALLCTAQGHADPQLPPLTGRVVDLANVLDANAKDRLTDALAQYELKTSTQIVVVTLPDLQGYPIEQWGLALLRGWQIGQKGKNNGVVLVIAPKDRELRIETGYGVEGPLPDATADAIIRHVIVPYFKKDDFADGIFAGVSSIEAALEGSFSAPATAPENTWSFMGLPWPAILICLLWLAIVLVNAVRRANTSGTRLYSGQRRDMFWGGGGFGGGGFGGGGGGGGFSGGGGSGGGGGASGGW